MEGCLSFPGNIFSNQDHQTSGFNLSCTLSQFDYTISNLDDAEYYKLRIITAIVLTAIMVLSIGPLGFLWHYERFGGDPQKRTILNQLIGVMALNNLIALVINIVVFLTRLFYGPLSMSAAFTTFFLPNGIAYTVVFLILNEIILLRFLSVFWWKQLPPINDDFFGVYFHCINYGLAILFLLMGQMGGNPNDHLFFLVSGFIHHQVTDFSATRFLEAIFMVTAIIHLICGVPLFYVKKIKSKDNNVPNGLSEAERHTSRFKYNNSRSNLDLANILTNLVIIGSFFVFFVVALMEWKHQVVVPTVWSYITIITMPSLIFSLKLVISKPEIIAHIRTFQL